jgi:MarR family transcriptional regulator, transcriptional regulator for hemolysin
VPVPDLDLAFLLNQASSALAARTGGALADLGISVREYCVLTKAAEGERTQIEVADLAALDKTTMVVTLDALEKAGLAERRVSSSDRRARVVVVTARGRRVLERAHTIVNGVTADALSDLDGAARDAVVSGLTAMTQGVLATPSHTTAMRRKQARPHKIVL